MLRRVTRRSQNRDGDVPQGHYIAVAYRLVIELEAGVGAGDDACSRSCGQLAAATEKIVVDVRLEDMRDADAFLARYFLILIDVAKRVDEGSDSISFGDHQVGAIAQARVDKLPDSHG